MNIWSTKGGGDVGVPSNSQSQTTATNTISGGSEESQLENTAKSTSTPAPPTPGGGQGSEVTFDTLGLSALLVQRIKNQIGNQLYQLIIKQSNYN